MSGDFEEKFIKPIINACYPGTLAGLVLAVFQITTNYPTYLKVDLLNGALAFTLSALFMFFYTIYPARKGLWTLAAVTFIFGLLAAILASVMLFFTLT